MINKYMTVVMLGERWRPTAVLSQVVGGFSLGGCGDERVGQANIWQKSRSQNKVLKAGACLSCSRFSKVAAATEVE